MVIEISSEDFWGCELSASNNSFKWDYPETDEDTVDHKLFVSQATLGVTAVDGDRNVIVAETEDGQSFIIGSCKLGLNESLNLNIAFTNSVTFKLIHGKGPIQLVGTHFQGFHDDEGDDYESDESLDEMADISGEGMKIGEIESKNSDTDSDDSEDNDSSDVDMENSSNSKQNGFGDSSDEEDNEDDDDSEDESEEQENKKTMPKKGGLVKSKDAKKAEKKVKFSLEKNKGEQKKGKQEKSQGGKVQDLTSLKKQLSACKTLPKNQQKFENYLKANLKVHDKKVSADLWLWYQKNKLKNSN